MGEEEQVGSKKGSGSLCLEVGDAGDAESHGPHPVAINVITERANHLTTPTTTQGPGCRLDRG